MPTIQYQLGGVYQYDYETSVLLNDPQQSSPSKQKDVGFNLQLKAEVASVWQNPTDAEEQILKLTVRNER